MNYHNYKKGFLNVIVALVIGAIAVLSGALIEKTLKSPTTDNQSLAEFKLGAAPTFTAGKLYTLYGGGISSSDTSIKLTSFTSPVANLPILTADLIQGVGSKFYITIEPATNRKETVGCTTVTQGGDGTATLSGCTRGYMFTYPYSASTTLQLSHSGGSRVVLSNSPQFYNDIITYIATITAAGVVDAGGTTKGIVESATAAEAASHAAVGSGNTTAPLVLQTNIASSTRTANTPQVVISSSTDGYIDSSYFNGVALTGGVNTFTNTATSSNTFSATTSVKIGAFPAYNIGKNILVFAVAGTASFSVPSGITKVHVRLIGGGGGAGGSNSSTIRSAGGGAGGGCEKMVDVSATSTITLTIGAGGAGAAAAGTGSTGGVTRFGGFFSGAGGSGGAGVAGDGGSGGVCTNSDFSLVGGSGQAGIGATGLTSGNAGTGGAGMFGGDQSYGSGGSGVVNSTGNSGSSGVIVVIW